MEKKTASAIMLTILLTSMLTLAFSVQPVNAEGTIYIRADGSIDPPTSPISSVDNATYFLIGNITSDANGIVVQRDNIIIDGAGYTIQGTGVYPFYLYNGIFLTKGNNVTTKNTRIENFYFGIYLNYSSYISIVGNNITNNDNGIYLDSSSNNLVCENYITNNDIGGIRLVYSDDNTLNGNNVTNNAEGISIIYSPHNSLANNTLAGNDRNFGVLGETEDDFLQNIETSNSVEGKTIYYWINQTAQVVPLNAGYVAVVGSRDIRVEGLNMSHNLQDILLAYSVNSTVEDNKLADSLYGVSLVGGGTNKVANNSIVNSDYGVGLRYSSHNNLSGNTFSEDTRGMLLIYSSNNNAITQNIFTEGSIGIDLVSADFNSISQNNFTGNQQGILIDSSFDNMIYHNSFVDNSHQVYVYSQSACIWDSGYPSGGNYWSDYTGVDANGDGIGDTPYVIDADNQDRYPLTHPWSPLPVHNINTGLGYATIQGAIDAPETLDGHTVFVGLGTYYENVFLYKSLTLIGEDSETTIVDGSRSGHVIHVTANNVMISGFTIQNGLGGLSLYYSDGDIISGNILTSNEWTGIEHHHSNNNIIHDNKVTLNGHGGMDVWNSSNNIITYNNVSNNSGHGILLEDASNKNEVSNNVVTENSVGIRLDYSTDNLVSYNNATLNVDCGIQLVYSENSNVKKNVVTLNSIGIMLHASEHNVIEDNKVTHNGEGILLASSNRNIVDANEAVENGGNGIRLYNSSYNEVSHNNASIDDTGIVLETSSNNNTLVGNNVASNYNGILVGYSSNNNSIYHNNFIDNTVQVVHITSGCVNVWDNGYPSGGNYWSDYVGVDVKSGPSQDLHGSDGMGDTPYIIDADNVDHYPLMNPYGAPPPPTYTLTITATVGGTTDPAPGTYAYTANSTVQVTAIPAANYLFDYWELDSVNVGSANPYSVLMDKNHALKAVFMLIPPPLSASISPLSAAILVGQSVTFTSTVSGGYTPYSYQWYLNGAPVSGATSVSWTFTPTSSGIYYIHLKVTDAKANTAQSDAARITTATVPVGGYSIPLKVPTKTEPVLPYIALIATLTVIFTKLRPKTKRKH